MHGSDLETSHGRLAYSDTGGDGMPVVMVHANSLCKESFAPQIDALKDRYRVLAIDLLGHGASSNAIEPRRSYSIPGYASAVEELLQGLGVLEFVGVGHSLGGHVVLEMLGSSLPIRGAFLFGTPPIENSLAGLGAGFKPSPEMAYTGSADVSDDQIKMVVGMALGEAAAEDGFFLAAVRRTDGLARQYMVEAAVAGEGCNQRHLAETSPVPLAIINGEDDPVINLDYIDTIAYANIRSGKPIRIAGAGHGVHRERAGELNQLLSKFLTDVLV
ncbi:alpha/beta fold hydrolase [Rhizobium sp. SGZ-381]|uniref:alpha/beta fold hydrolase n=1 Tax=Rhizobium sp. SGZ-381 TaxID=3342800 RepID=UPI00366BB4AC